MKFQKIIESPPKSMGPHLVTDGENVALMNYYGEWRGVHDWRSYAHHPFHEVVWPTHYCEIEMPNNEKMS
jgi:hypothetical protein